jgi:hypothetical protein
LIWGLGIGDWGLGIGDWGLGPIPNPQSPIPNPQSPYQSSELFYPKYLTLINKCKYFNFKMKKNNPKVPNPKYFFS